ncbi:hypothetical protein [Helicobacter sp. MIT 05-5294]|uniref:hypothetical protein n=1 Tax=Helicobacter sp. MIT 05-5294 TaxID=1548150 RepID=UPI0010FE495C|nr:hypothetical protein [Helicobacter sp. MIT 05-5294]TLD86510.1 hypothetical protein LS69_005780 [Helicobacter sp. MIT 05-5294]
MPRFHPCYFGRRLGVTLHPRKKSLSIVCVIAKSLKALSAVIARMRKHSWQSITLNKKGFYNGEIQDY